MIGANFPEASVTLFDFGWSNPALIVCTIRFVRDHALRE